MFDTAKVDRAIHGGCPGVVSWATRPGGWKLEEGSGLWEEQDLNTPHSFSHGTLKVKCWSRSRPVEAAPLCLPKKTAFLPRPENLGA